MPPWSAVAGYGRFAERSQPDARRVGPAGGVGGRRRAEWTDAARKSSSRRCSRPPARPGSTASPTSSSQPAAAHAVTAGAADSVQRFEIATASRPSSACTDSAFKPGDRRVVRYAAVYETGHQSLAVLVDAVGHEHAPAGGRGVHAAGERQALRRDRLSRHRGGDDRHQRGRLLPGDKAPAAWPAALSMQAAGLERPGRRRPPARAANWCWTSPPPSAPSGPKWGPARRRSSSPRCCPMAVSGHCCGCATIARLAIVVRLRRPGDAAARHRLVMTTYVTNTGDAADPIATPSASDARPAPAPARSERRHDGDTSAVHFDSLGVCVARWPPAGRGWPASAPVLARPCRASAPAVISNDIFRIDAELVPTTVTVRDGTGPARHLARTGRFQRRRSRQRAADHPVRPRTRPGQPGAGPRHQRQHARAPHGRCAERAAGVRRTTC